MPGEHDTSTQHPRLAGVADVPRGGLDEATIISAATPGGPSTSVEIGRQLVGTTLGPYRLEQFVGGGGMGAVFRGHDTTLDRIVAVKVLAGRESDDEEMLRRFRNEAQSAARLDHENIGRVYAVGSEGGWHYIVFEFIEGRNLRDLVREEGPFDLARTVDVAVQVADALEHASQRAVVHRDIKPSNIVITPGGRARVVDMGLARLHQMAGDRDLTMSGMTLGTFDYISPEQARDPRAADVRSDLYSLGCTIFYMLVGRPPFAEGTMVQKLLQHQQEPPPAIEALRPDVPRAFAAILERLMAKDPTDRPQRPATLVAELMAFADAEGISLVAPRPTMTLPPTVSPLSAPSLLPWLVPLGALLALVGWLWIESLRPVRRPQPQAAVPAIPEPVRDARPPRLVRVSAPVEQAAIVDALGTAADGDIIELAFSQTVDIPALALANRHLVLRAAPGSRPALRFVTTVTGSGGIPTACDIGDGSLEIRGVALAYAAPLAAERPALFAVGAGTLSCEDVLLEMPDAGGEPSRNGAGGRAAFVAVQPAEEVDPGPGCTLMLVTTRACGDAVFLDATDRRPSRVVLSWLGGGLITSRQLLATAGTTGAGTAGTGTMGDGERRVEMSLDDATFACRDGIVLATDSRSQPALAQVRITARGCTFLTEGTPLAVQTGIGEPEDYEAALTWRNRGSRHEGTDVFRRIDGAAERIDMLFRDQPTVFRHAAQVDRWPDATAWRAAWSARSD
jgi:serine/threonine protein kinase